MAGLPTKPQLEVIPHATEMLGPSSNRVANPTNGLPQCEPALHGPGIRQHLAAVPTYPWVPAASASANDNHDELAMAGNTYRPPAHRAVVCTPPGATLLAWPTMPAGRPFANGATFHGHHHQQYHHQHQHQHQHLTTLALEQPLSLETNGLASPWDLAASCPQEYSFPSLALDQPINPTHTSLASKHGASHAVGAQPGTTFDAAQHRPSPDANHHSFHTSANPTSSWPPASSPDHLGPLSLTSVAAVFRSAGPPSAILTQGPAALLPNQLSLPVASEPDPAYSSLVYACDQGLLPSQAAFLSESFVDDAEPAPEPTDSFVASDLAEPAEDHRPQELTFKQLQPRKNNAAQRQGPATSQTQAVHDGRVRKVRQRRHYEKDEAAQVKQTRDKRGCIRCRLRRVKCVPDLTNLGGPCIACQKHDLVIQARPCVRAKVTDCVLFRMKNNHDTVREERFPLTGTDFGLFNRDKQWKNATVKFLKLTQGSTVLELPARELVLDQDLDPKFHKSPWALTSLHDGVGAVKTFIEQSIAGYVQSRVDQKDFLQYGPFSAAQDLAYGSQEDPLLKQTLRLWVAMRFIEGNWRCCGDDNLGAEEQTAHPWHPQDWVSPPKYIDYELASILLGRLLDSMRRQLLKDYEDLMSKAQAERRRSWYRIFLASFVLLHSYQLSMAHEVQFATRRGLSTRYKDMNLVRNLLQGANVILHHFHTFIEGHYPFQHSTFDWKALAEESNPSLIPRHIEFLKQYAQEVRNRRSIIEVSQQSEEYESSFWFTGQLFNTSWQPIAIPDHNPSSIPQFH